MASERSRWFLPAAGGGHGRVLLVGLCVLAAAVGSCIGADAHPADGKAQADPCDVEPVSINAGAERSPSGDPTASALMPYIPNATVAMHCGMPDAPPTVTAAVAPSVRPYAERAPPRA